MIKKISGVALLLIPCIVNADFMYITKPKAEKLPTKHYGPPVEAFQATPSTVTTVPSIKNTVTRIGRAKGLSGKKVLPSMEIFSRKISDVLPMIIPNSFSISIYNGVVLSDKIAVSFKAGTPWELAFEKILKSNNLAATIDWNSNVITVVNNKRETIATQQDKGLEVESDSDTYIIRKKSDDIIQSQNEGFLIKDGKAIRFDSAPN